MIVLSRPRCAVRPGVTGRRGRRRPSWRTSPHTRPRVSGCNTTPARAGRVGPVMDGAGVDLATEPQPSPHVLPVDRRGGVLDLGGRPGRSGRRAPAVSSSTAGGGNGGHRASGVRRGGSGRGSGRSRGVGTRPPSRTGAAPAAGKRSPTPRDSRPGHGAADGETAPQFRGVPLPHQMPAIVVTVGAQRLTDRTVAVLVDRHAPGRPPMRTQILPVPVGGPAAPATGPASLLRRMHRPERRCGQSGEHQRMRRNLGRHLLHAARRAGHDQVVDVALVLDEHDSHRPAAVPHRRYVNRSGSEPDEYDASTSPVTGLIVSEEPTTRIGCAQCPTCATWTSHRPRSGRASPSVTCTRTGAVSVSTAASSTLPAGCRPRVQDGGRGHQFVEEHRPGAA